MSPPATLSRAEFDQACKAYITREQPKTLSNATRWSWHEHPLYRLGYMSRQAVLFPSRQSTQPKITVDERSDISAEELLDQAALDPIAAGDIIFTLHEHVVYSATFNVAVFYFNVYRPNGSPLTLDEILSTSLIRRHALPPAEPTPFALTAVQSTFPLLSQGDHPTLGTPFWYFHPCETSTAVGEIMAEVGRDGWSEDDRLARWMHAWFMVLEGVIDLNQ